MMLLQRVRLVLRHGSLGGRRVPQAHPHGHHQEAVVHVGTTPRAIRRAPHPDLGGEGTWRGEEGGGGQIRN
jgi:hypothetical protein